MTKIPQKLGEMLVSNGLLTESQLLAALEAQNKSRRFLGEIIVDLGFTTKEKLDAALAHQYGSILGEILIRKGYVTFEQLQNALEDQKSSTKTLGEVLIDRGYIAESDLMDGLSQQYKIPYVRLATYAINPEAAGRVPLDALKKYCVFPIDVQDNMLIVATSNPEDFVAESDLRFLSGMYVRFVLASRSELLSFLE